MFSNRLFYLNVAASIILVLNGCAVRRFPVVRPVEEQSRDTYARIKAEEHFVRARDYERRGLVKMAEREYEKALQLDPKSKVLKKKLVECYIASEKYTQALLLIKEGRKNEELSDEEKRTVSMIYLKMGEISRAAEMLESIPDKSDGEYYSLGLIYESQGNTEKAISSYYRCYKNNSEALQVGFKVGRMMLNDRKYKEAEDFLVEMQESHGIKPDIYCLRALAALGRGDTIRGLQFFDSALTIDSLHEETLRNKAQYYIGLNDFPSAIECYEKLTKYNTTVEFYGRTLAVLYLYNDQPAEAESLLKRMLESSMDDYELHYLLGLVFASVDNVDLARIEFGKSLALQEKNKQTWYELCRMLMRKKKYSEAADAADRFIRVLPDDALAWRTKGQVESLKKKYSDAIAALKKAVSLDSLDAYAWFELGSAFERNKDIDRAAKAFRMVLQLRPKDPATLNYLGYMWAEHGKNLDTAKAFLEEALGQDPHNGAFLDSYAWIYYQMGNYDSAFTYLQKAFEKIYDDPVLFHHLGDVLAKKKDFDGAASSYYKSLDFNSEEEEIIRRKIVDINIILQYERRPAQ